jgi:hypothetical protein
MNIIRISTNSYLDHTARLYNQDGTHVDMEGCTMTVINSGKLSTTIEATDNAVREFIADMEYQIEFMDSDYCGQCKRALATVKKQIGLN